MSYCIGFKLDFIIQCLVFSLLLSSCGLSKNKLSFKLSAQADSVLNDTASFGREADSLKSSILNAQSDTLFINYLNRIAELVYGESTRILAEEAIKHSSFLRYHYGVNDGLSKLGLYYFRIKQFEKSDSLLKLALIQSEQEEQKGIQEQCLLWLGESKRLQYDKDLAISYYQQGYALSQKTGNTKRRAEILVRWGIALQKTDIKSAKSNFERALKISNSTGDKNIQADAYRSLADLNSMEDNAPEALSNFQKAILLSQQTKNFRLLSFSLIGKGALLAEQGNSKEALVLYDKALLYAHKINDRTLQLTVLTKASELAIRVGNIALGNEKLDSAIHLSSVMNNKSKLAYCLALKGDAAIQSNQKIEAVSYYSQALKISTEIGDDNIAANCLSQIGSIHLSENNLMEAKTEAVKSLEIAKKSNSKNDLKNAAYTLFTIYQRMEKFKDALEMYVLYSNMQDSIENIESVKKFDEIKNQNEIAIQESKQKFKDFENEKEINKHKNVRNIFIVAFILLGILAFVIYRSLQANKKAKLIIEGQRQISEQQRKIIAAKQKETLDSINHAKRLQKAILPPTELLNRVFKDYFVLYKPKDIVAGDFYWMAETELHLFFAVADCTGHGVPGAMMSIVCSNALNKVVREFGYSNTGEILDKVTDLVIETFDKSDEMVRDGMDISLLSFHKQSKKICWSGANSRLWYFDKNELVEIKPDKQPIGNYEQRKKFTQVEISYFPNLIFYLISDGYADQFGGELDKKFSVKKLRQLILHIYNLPFEKQKIELENAIETWQGDVEQTDDITIAGLCFG